VPAFALLTAAFFVRVVRWHSLFAPGGRPGLRPLATALFAGYLFNNLLPVRAGEAVRIGVLNKLTRTPVTEATATVLVERAYDVLSLVVLLFVTLPWLPHVTWLRAAGFLALGLTIALAVAAFVFARFGAHAARWAFRPLVRLTFLPRELIERAPDDFLRGLSGLLRPRIALVAFAWTTFSWIIAGFAYWLVMLAFHLELSPVAGLLVVIGIGLAMILPSSPAALGVFEGAGVVVLGAYGIVDSRALSYALVLHALSFVPFVVLAVPVLGTRLLQRGSAIAQAEPPRP
jgi:uncharacterized protein (TIRG00374 family)